MGYFSAHVEAINEANFVVFWIQVALSLLVVKIQLVVERFRRAREPLNPPIEILICEHEKFYYYFVIEL